MVNFNGQNNLDRAGAANWGFLVPTMFPVEALRYKTT